MDDIRGSGAFVGVLLVSDGDHKKSVAYFWIIT